MRLFQSALIFILFANALLFLAQTASTNIYDNYIYPEGTRPNYFNLNGTVLGGVNSENEISSLLPSAQTSVDPETGGLFTDVFSTLKNAILEIPGLNYIYKVLTAIPSLLGGFGLPPEFVDTINVLWFGFTLFALISMLFKGG